LACPFSLSPFLSRPTAAHLSVVFFFGLARQLSSRRLQRFPSLSPFRGVRIETRVFPLPFFTPPSLTQRSTPLSGTVICMHPLTLPSLASIRAMVRKVPFPLFSKVSWKKTAIFQFSYIPVTLRFGFASFPFLESLLLVPVIFFCRPFSSADLFPLPFPPFPLCKMGVEFSRFSLRFGAYVFPLTPALDG